MGLRELARKRWQCFACCCFGSASDLLFHELAGDVDFISALIDLKGSQYRNIF